MQMLPVAALCRPEKRKTMEVLRSCLCNREDRGTISIPV
jgi:hypothetical protein